MAGALSGKKLPENTPHPPQRLAISRRKLASLMKSRYNNDTCCWFLKDLGGPIYLFIRFLSLFLHTEGICISKYHKQEWTVVQQRFVKNTDLERVCDGLKGLFSEHL